MIQYTLVDPMTGELLSLSEIDLTQSLRINCILLCGDEHIGVITHRDLVVFARWCAGVMLPKLRGEPDQRVIHVLQLVDRWLDGEGSVSNEKLKAAADAADAAAGAAWAAQAAADAAHDAQTAQVAAYAAHATWAAAQAAADAAHAAQAAAAEAAQAVSYKTQAHWLVEHLQSGK